MNIDMGTFGDRTVVSVFGDIDTDSAPLLREQLVELVNDGSYDIVVDLDGVGSIDDTGLEVLVGGLKSFRAHEGSLRLVCNREPILKTLRSTGLIKVFPIHPDVQDAVNATD